MASLNKVAGSNNSNNDTSLERAQENLAANVEKLMRARFKNDPKKASSETEKFLKEFESRALEIQEKAADIEIKTKKEIKEDQFRAEKELLKLRIAAEKDDEKRKKLLKELEAKETAQALKKSLSKIASRLISDATAQIKQQANLYGQYSASINARLQTFKNQKDEAFNGLSNLIRKNTALSPYIKQEEMLSNLNELVELGINYNLEQRAFLTTVTDKIVTTFNALDETLLHMVRLQQQDTTQARMGMEAYLTKYLNSAYEDSSYLNSLYDTVTENLFEASSQLGRDASIELEYVVQKWLGSLYSVGVGSDFISTIAQGLGYLGSGNVDALNSNSSLQNLLVMAANRSGVDYSSILTQGLNANTANKLLQGIVGYVQEISKSNNQVVRSQYAQIFGMSLSDMTATLNLKLNDLISIGKDILTYDKATLELSSQLSLVGDRMQMSERLTNLYSNLMASTAGKIASSPAKYMTYMATDIVKNILSDLPSIGVMGNFIDLGGNIAQILQGGIVGLNLVSSLVGGLSSLSNGGSLSLNNWAGNESTSRGSGFGAITSGYSSTTSTSAYIGSSSSSDIYSSSVTAAKDQAKEENKGSEDEEEDILDLTKIIISILQGWSSVGAVRAEIIGTPTVQLQNYGLTASQLG